MSTLPRRTAVAVCLFVAAAVVSSPAESTTLRRVPLYRAGIQADYVTDVALANVYGPASSGRELVACSAGSAYAMQWQSSQLRTIWLTEDINCTATAAADLDGDGANEVVIGTSNDVNGQPGTIRIHVPLGFGAPRANLTLPGTLPVSHLAVGNVDAEPGIEIVVATTGHTYVYDAATLALEWTFSGRGGTFVGIADLENDGQAEIILSGSGGGQVLNGTTRAYKWGYVGGFGSLVALGDVDGDGKPEIIGQTGTNVVVVNGDTQTTSSFTAGGYGYPPGALAVGDGNNDGQLEIITGDDQWGSVRGYTANGTQLWSVANPEHGVSALGVGDLDGDGISEVLWGAGFTSSGEDNLFVANPLTAAIKWSGLDLDGPMAAKVADLDGDGSPEFIMQTAQSNSGYAAGILQVHRQKSGTVSSTTVPAYGPKLAVGQLDGDAALEIAVLGGSYYSGARISVFDGITLANEWTSPAVSYGAPGIASSLLIIQNLDNDAVDEIVVATTDSKIQILNGASPFVQNASPALNGAVKAGSIADLDGDAVLDLVVGTAAGFHVLKLSDMSERVFTPVSGYGVWNVAATEGEFAVVTDSYSGPWTLTSYSGSSLLAQWSCAVNPRVDAMVYAELSDELFLVAGTARDVMLYPTGGDACPTVAVATLPIAGVVDLSLVDYNGDGTRELISATNTGAGLDLIDTSDDPRGDADDDDLVTDDDMDVLAEHFFGDGNVPAAGGDVNGDSALRAEDLFYLINYRLGTGEAPPQ
jgi:hypothetical protein